MILVLGMGVDLFEGVGLLEELFDGGEDLGLICVVGEGEGVDLCILVFIVGIVCYCYLECEIDLLVV